MHISMAIAPHPAALVKKKEIIGASVVSWSSPQGSRGKEPFSGQQPEGGSADVFSSAFRP